MVDVPYSNLDLKETPKWCTVGCESKNEHWIDLCSKKSGLRAQNLLHILDVTVSINEETYMNIYKLIESSLWQQTECSYKLWKSWGKWLQAWFGFANCLTLIPCFHIIREVGAEKNVHSKPAALNWKPQTSNRLWCGKHQWRPCQWKSSTTYATIAFLLPPHWNSHRSSITSW